MKHDRSDRLDREDALARAQASLNAEMIAHNLTREQLLHANRLTTIGKLTAGIVHEMGTPLNVITARGRMILRGQARGEQVLEDVQIMVEQAERLTQMVRKLLDHSRQRPARQPVPDVGALCERLLQWLGPAARRNEVALELVAPVDPVAVCADAGEVEQVLVNLISNAVDAQPNGGRVRVEVDRTADQGARWVVVRVLDEGPGIPMEHLDRVFEPFFTTKGPGKGTGLGLAVSASLVRRQGGRIAVQNLPHGGAQFAVYLPPAEAER